MSDDFWWTPAADAPLTDGVLLQLRPRGGTTARPIWPSPNYAHLTIVISDVITRVLSDSDLAPVPPPKKRPVAKVQRAKRPPRVVGEALIARWCVEKRYRKGVPGEVSTQTVWEMMRTRWGTMCVELGFDPKEGAATGNLAHCRRLAGSKIAYRNYYVITSNYDSQAIHFDFSVPSTIHEVEDTQFMIQLAEVPVKRKPGGQPGPRRRRERGLPTLAFRVSEFCDAHRIEQVALLRFEKQGLGPRETALLGVTVITAEDAAAWRAGLSAMSARK